MTKLPKATPRVLKHPPCPITRFMGVLGAKWSAAIVYHVGKGANRFGGLTRAIPEVSKQVLTLRLRELEGAGILKRVAMPDGPLHVEYSLTNSGLVLLPALDAMAECGAENLRLEELADLV